MGLIRLFIFVTIAFGVGVLYERAGARERCETAGGQWVRTATGASLCSGEIK